MSEAGPVTLATRPSFPTIRRIDAAWYRVERFMCGALFLLMTLIVCASVVRDVFGTSNLLIDGLVLFVIIVAAMFTREGRDTDRVKTWQMKLAASFVAALALAGLIDLYVTLLPGGFQWASKAALCLMLWVGFLGSSVATYEKAHLALEVGEKIWPKAAQHLIKAFAHGLTSAACVVLLLLSLESLAAHHEAWTLGATGIPTLEWLPQWVVFAIFPYTFGAMAVRFMAQMVTSATKTDQAPASAVPESDALRTGAPT